MKIPNACDLWGIWLGDGWMLLGIEDGAGCFEMPHVFYSREDAENWLGEFREWGDWEHGIVAQIAFSPDSDNLSAAAPDLYAVAVSLREMATRGDFPERGYLLAAIELISFARDAIAKVEGGAR